MLQVIAALQPLIIGAVLLWSGSLKLFSKYAESDARRTALTRLIGEKRTVPAYRALGVVEMLLAAALIAPPALTAETAAASALGAGFLGYLAYARISAPDSSCGCMGSAPTPVTWRSFARAGLLLAGSLTALVVAPGTGWYTALGDAPVLAVAVVALGLAAYTGFSPELDHRWLIPLRRLHNRITHPLAGGGEFTVPLASSVAQLLRSGVYREVSPLLLSDVTDHWDDGEWRILTYSARYGGRPATAVFAVPRLRYEPDAVRVALVDEETAQTVYTLDAPPVRPDGEEPAWALTAAVPEHVHVH